MPVKKATEREIRAYLANQFGFSETGRYVLNTLIKPRIRSIGIQIYDPFLECAKELDAEYLSRMDLHEDRVRYLTDFSRKVTPLNNRLLRNSDCLLAILDGGHSIDDGVASEIGYYSGIERGPIFALRSDLRGGENLAVTINPQVLGYILQSKGYFIDGKDAIERWFDKIRVWHERRQKHV